jgi:transposase-like protein
MNAALRHTLPSPKCRDTAAVKNGIMQGKQRYKCKGCGCNYTQSTVYRFTDEIRKRCIELYLEGIGFRGISRLTGVSPATVMRWVRILADKIDMSLPEENKRVAIMELDDPKGGGAKCGILSKKNTKMLGLDSV